MVQSAREFIETKGAQEVADATGRFVGAVRVWKTRNRFARSAWLELSQAYPELTLDTLKRLDAERGFWNGMSSAEVMRATGISKGHLSKIRSDRRGCSPEMAIRIQEVTGLSAIRLVFGDLADKAA
jgi:hypothetical protein